MILKTPLQEHRQKLMVAYACFSFIICGSTLLKTFVLMNNFIGHHYKILKHYHLITNIVCNLSGFQLQCTRYREHGSSGKIWHRRTKKKMADSTSGGGNQVMFWNDRTKCKYLLSMLVYGVQCHFHNICLVEFQLCYIFYIVTRKI